MVETRTIRLVAIAVATSLVATAALATDPRFTLEEADGWAERPDAWYLSTIWDREPRGVFTCACPIHPFRVRYYSTFGWSLEEPWRLYCPCCREEGRAYDYYPNPRYPDEGDGCFPTDEVWREDHDAAWSRAHDGNRRKRL